MATENQPLRLAVIVVVLALSADAWSQLPGQPPSPSTRPLGVLTHISSNVAGEKGIAVRVVAPEKPRYKAGTPVVITVPGGHEAGQAGGAVRGSENGFVEVYPELAWYVSWESPFGDGILGAEFGTIFQGRLNPAYDPKTSTLDLSNLAYDADLRLPPFNMRKQDRESAALPHGGLFFDWAFAILHSNSNLAQVY